MLPPPAAVMADEAALLGDSVEEAYDRARTRKLTPEKAQELRHARWCVYASQFLHKVAWGAYSVVSPFYLALFMSTAAAANVATAEWAAYSIGQVLCTPILGAATDQAGRRPVFVVCQMLITIVFLVLFWPNLYWWAITGFVQGCFLHVGRQHHHTTREQRGHRAAGRYSDHAAVPKDRDAGVKH